MRNLGEDIVLLAIGQDGTIAAVEKLRFAVAGAELVRLAASRNIDVDDAGVVEILDAGSTGDAFTDSALRSLKRMGPPREARRWVGMQRSGMVRRVLKGLAEAGTIRAGNRGVRGLFLAPRWIVIDVDRVADARSRLDAIAFSTGPVTAEQAAFAGLVHAVGLPAVLYPDSADQAARIRLGAITLQDATSAMVRDAADLTSSAAGASAEAATDAAIQSATWSAVKSSVQATHHAAVHHQQTTHSGGFEHHGHGGGGGGMAGGHHG